MTKLNLFFEGNDNTSDFFKNYVNYNDCNIEDCDYIISSSFEMGNVDKKDLQRKLHHYKNCGKKVIIFLISDFCDRLEIPSHVFLYRTSLYKSKKKANEQLLPYIWEGFEESFHALNKTEKPIVGFCGSVKNNTGKRLSSINKLKSSNQIETNFIPKQSFWGGNPNDSNLRNDFKNNILESHFTLSNRGAGNFSMRFYQVLSLGRIPVLIDSDMIFPFENEINWDEIIVKAKNENELVSNINHWWSTKSNDEIKAIQFKCKQVYDQYITPKSFGEKVSEFLFSQKDVIIETQKKSFFSTSIFDFLKPKQ